MSARCRAYSITIAVLTAVFSLMQLGCTDRRSRYEKLLRAATNEVCVLYLMASGGSMGAVPTYTGFTTSSARACKDHAALVSYEEFVQLVEAGRRHVVWSKIRSLDGNGYFIQGSVGGTPFHIKFPTPHDEYETMRRMSAIVADSRGETLRYMLANWAP